MQPLAVINVNVGICAIITLTVRNYSFICNRPVLPTKKNEGFFYSFYFSVEHHSLILHHINQLKIGMKFELILTDLKDF